MLDVTCNLCEWEGESCDLVVKFNEWLGMADRYCPVCGSNNWGFGKKSYNNGNKNVDD